jgi:hypothetical protein
MTSLVDLNNYFAFDDISDEVVADVNVFRLCRYHGVGYQCLASIVDLEHSSILVDTEGMWSRLASKNMSEEEYLLDYIKYGYVLCFHSCIESSTTMD